MTFYRVPAHVFQGISEYLATRPYREVANAMTALASLQPEEEPSDDAATRLAAD